MTDGQRAEGQQDGEAMTIDEFAALCREKCHSAAQGYDDGRACGSTSHDPVEGEVFHFCGRHWGAVL